MATKGITLPSGQLTVPANEENNRPFLTNQSDKTVTVKIEAEGQWNYGDPEKHGINKLVDADGNPEPNPEAKPKLRYPDIRPAALVALKDNKPVAHGKNQTIELKPGETVSFINNDQPGIYTDNKGSQTVKWKVVGASSSTSSSGQNSVPSGSQLNQDNKITLPSDQLTVEAKEDKDFPALTNESDKTITLKIQAEGQWNYGEASYWGINKLVDADGNPQGNELGQYKEFLRFKDIKPAALVVFKNNQAVAHGKEQTIELKPGQTVSFINNDIPGWYSDNKGSQTVKWSVVSIN